MSSDPRPFFPVDSDLWQKPGPSKLHWAARKVAIHLRGRAGPHKDRDNIALTRPPAIAEATDLTPKQVRHALKRLRQWPTPDAPFIIADDADGIALRPVPRKHTKVYRRLWDAPIPDDIKDVLLFIRSRYTREDKNGAELFDCNTRGTKQPSIGRYCYLQGTHWPTRLRRLGRIIATLIGSGLMRTAMPAKRPDASSKGRAAVVRLFDETPPAGFVERVLEALGEPRGNAVEERHGVTRSVPEGNEVLCHEVTQLVPRGNDTPESPESVPESTKSVRGRKAEPGNIGGEPKTPEGQRLLRIQNLIIRRGRYNIHASQTDIDTLATRIKHVLQDQGIPDDIIARAIETAGGKLDNFCIATTLTAKPIQTFHAELELLTRERRTEFLNGTQIIKNGIRTFIPNVDPPTTPPTNSRSLGAQHSEPPSAGVMEGPTTETAPEEPALALPKPSVATEKTEPAPEPSQNPRAQGNQRKAQGEPAYQDEADRADLALIDSLCECGQQAEAAHREFKQGFRSKNNVWQR